jgi:hypothetical protein
MPLVCRGKREKENYPAPPYGKLLIQTSRLRTDLTQNAYAAYLSLIWVPWYSTNGIKLLIHFSPRKVEFFIETEGCM